MIEEAYTPSHIRGHEFSGANLVSEKANSSTLRHPVILMYGKVTGETSDYRLTGVSSKNFALHLAYLAETCQVVPLADLLSMAASSALKPGLVALTFDEGYFSVMAEALPLLESCRIPATVFVTSSKIRSSEFWQDSLNHLPYMNREELKHLSESSLIEIGMQIPTPSRLPAIIPEDLQRGIAADRALIEAITGKPIPFFSHCFQGEAESQTQAVRIIRTQFELFAVPRRIVGDWDQEYFSLWLEGIDAEGGKFEELHFKTIIGKQRSASTIRPEHLYDGPYLKVRAYLEAGNTQKAAQELGAILKVNPNLAVAHNDLGAIEAAFGELEKALFHYRRAVELRPDQITFVKNLADLLSLREDGKKEAARIYTRILSENPRDVDALYGMGSICRTIGKDEDARAFFQAVLSADPMFPGPRGDPEQIAEKQIEPESNRQGDSKSEGEPEQTMKLYLKRLAANPRDVETLMDIGMLCESVERPDDARSFYNTVLAIEPWHAAARERMAETN